MGRPAESTWLKGDGGRALGLPPKMLRLDIMTPAKPAFPAPDHDHNRCTADAIAHAEQVCAKRAQKFTLIREHCGSVGEIPATLVAQGVNAAARASGFAPKMSVVEIAGTCAHCQK